MPRVWSTPESILVSQVHAAAARVILIWMTCAVTGAMVASGPELLLRTICGIMILLQLWSVMMPIACVNTEGHWNHVVLSQPALHWS